MEDESNCDWVQRWTNRVAAFKAEGKGENWPTSRQCPGSTGANNQIWTNSHLVIKGMSTKWAKAHLIPFMGIISLMERRGSRCHVSCLPSAFDSVSDAILILNKLKREIYKRLTQALSNCSRGWVTAGTVAVPGRAGQASAIVTGVIEGPLCWSGGKHKMHFRTGTSSYEMVLSGKSNGQIQLGSSLAERLQGRNWACELKLGSAVFLRQGLMPHWDVPTRVWLARGRHKPFSSTLLQVRLVLGNGCPRIRAPSWTQGQPLADRRPGEHHLWGKSKDTACPCSAWRREEGYFNTWGCKAEGNYSALWRGQQGSFGLVIGK